MVGKHNQVQSKNASAQYHLLFPKACSVPLDTCTASSLRSAFCC
jgi:hypothetical protein